MCPIVEKIKENFLEITKYDTNKELDKKKIECIANEILEYYNQSGKVEIIKIAQDMGFIIFSSTFKDKLVSGYISISEENVKEYNSAKIMKINREDSPGHRRFTVAHEIGHYLFDYNNITEEKYLDASYKTDEVSSIEEKRACYFAACLLLPEQSFINTYKKYLAEGFTNYDLVEKIALELGVSKRAVEIRFNELDISFINTEANN